MMHFALCLPTALLVPAGRFAVHPLRTTPLRCTEAAEVPVLASTRLPRLSIEYCAKCNWMLRSVWLQQEILTTFDGTIAEVALIPNQEGDGTFECKMMFAEGDMLAEQVVWDRKTDGGFPEAKELKQRVRDVISPDDSLGHSDTDEKKAKKAEDGTARSALQRLLSVVRLDRLRRGEKKIR